MKINEDFDMKIASDSPSKDLQGASGAPDVFSEALKEHNSGNLKQARRFGADMADRLLRAQAKLTHSGDDAPALQYKILFAFCVAAGLELYSGSTFVFRAALNAFYDRLRETHRDLYEDLDSTGAFSFYYLAFRKGGSTPEHIGAAFAMMNGKEGDPELTGQGSLLYSRFLRYVVSEMRTAKICSDHSE